MSTPKIVLMTGSSAGIGLATVERLARDPDKRFLVVATVISFAEKGELVAVVGDALNKTIVIKELDVTKDNQIKTVVEEVVKEYGRIDLLLNIAGIAIGGLVESLSRDQIDLTFNINTIGVIRLTQAVLPHMKRQRAGKIVTITSYVGRMGSPFLEVYSASRFATEGFFESLAAIARTFNIWVSMIEPNIVNTGLASGIFSGVEKAVAGDSMGETERHLAQTWLEFVRSRPMLTTADVVRKLLEIIESGNPCLRYQVPESMFAGPLGEIFCDFTGENIVSSLMKRMSGSTEQK